MTVRMTQYAAGGGCACKVPIGELERLLAGVDLPGGPDLLVGDDGDDAALRLLDQILVGRLSGLRPSRS